MKLLETRVIEVGATLMVELTLADDDEAGERITMRLRPEAVQNDWHLPAIQRAALHRARDVIADEIQAAVARLNTALSRSGHR